MEQTYFSVVGPTAVGKTSLALLLAAELAKMVGSKRAHVISADSRQVYRGLETLTGADIPQEFNPAADERLPYAFFDDGKILLHGISIIEPDEEWSVAHFKELAGAVISLAREKNEPVVIVGGTGLYHRHLFSDDEELIIPPDSVLREKAEKLSAAELRDWLSQVDNDRLAAMNESDRNNPRRLVRSLEIAHSLQSRGQMKKSTSQSTPRDNIKHIYIGLKLSAEDLKEKIADRVLQRVAHGAEDEVAELLSRSENRKLPAFSTLGVRELAAHLEGELETTACLQLWSRREFSYAKRQITWWKKQQDITWFDVGTSDWQTQALKFAKIQIGLP